MNSSFGGCLQTQPRHENRPVMHRLDPLGCDGIYRAKVYIKGYLAVCHSILLNQHILLPPRAPNIHRKGKPGGQVYIYTLG